jgi:Arc/MetJ-type ribon-helix-helix transcriptional regulator
VPKQSYKSLVIPSSLYEKIKAHVEQSEGRFVSVSEVVRLAVWGFLKDAS